MELVLDVYPRRKYIVCVDGLDDIVFRTDNRLRVLGALIEAASDLNSEFEECNKAYKFVVACRSDVLTSIPSANMNKIAQDRAVRLDWYQDIQRPERSTLFALVNRKARVSIPEVIDVFSELLPRRVELRNNGVSRHARVPAYLLSYTRHTPRDLLRLLAAIQGVVSHDSVSEASILAGIKNYAHNYFLGEVMDGTNQESIQDTRIVLDLIRQHGKHLFRYKDLADIAREERAIQPGRLKEVLRDLYECGGIGNIHLHRNSPYYTFQYRNEGSSLLLGTPMILHNALSRALNVKMDLANIEPGVLTQPPNGSGTTAAVRATRGTHKKKPRRRTYGGVPADQHRSSQPTLDLFGTEQGPEACD